MYGSTLGCRFWPILFGVLFSPACVVVNGQTIPPSQLARPAEAANLAKLANLRSGELTVWESGSGALLGWDAIQSALKAEFPELRVSFRLVEPSKFVSELEAARSDGTLPDAVFVDNWGQGAPLIAQPRVVEMMGRDRFFPSRGWWFAMLEGKHADTATAFLHWLEDDPKWVDPRMSSVGMTSNDRKEAEFAAMASVTELARGDDNSPLMDPDATRFSTAHWGTDCGRVADVAHPEVRFLFGNARLAYAAVSSEERSSGGRVECLGVMHSFLVLRKRGDEWKVLLLMPSVSMEQAVSLADQFDRLGMVPDLGAAPAVPNLLSPSDGEPQTRFPKQDISWQQDVPRPAAYAVESRAGQPSSAESDFGSSIITFVKPGDYGDIVRMPEPFGVGMQPHRWRIWAIGKDGQLALSEWRTVQFIN